MGCVVIVPLVAAGPVGKVYRIGVLYPTRPELPSRFSQAFEEGLRELGYVEGRNLQIVRRYGDGTESSYAQAANDIVRSDVDVIVTGANAMTDAAKRATSTIPIVMLIGTDVVHAGYVRSLARPSGNITGFAWDVEGTIEKRLDLLKEAVPRISRVAVLWEAPYGATQREATGHSASLLGLSLFALEFSGDLEHDFRQIASSGAEGVYVQSGGRLFQARHELAAIAMRHRLPTLFTSPAFVDAGGLMSYAPNFVHVNRAAARHIDKILRGAHPGDLPIEQPARIELVINLQTAKALGVAIPQLVVLRAQRVIE